MTLQEKMLAVIDDVNAELAEREELVELIAIALLTRKNLFVLGKPGQAKSYAVNLFRRHITGARQFERLLSKQTDEDQLFGRIDLSSLIPGVVPESVLQNESAYRHLHSDLQRVYDGFASQNDDVQNWEELVQATDRLETYRRAVAALHHSEPVVQTTGKIPEADIVFLDECFKANDGVLNSLLTALNERKYTNEGRTYTIPTISFFAASNEIPNFNDPQERILEALYDRLEIKVVTENIEEREKRLATLRRKQTCVSERITATITLDELISMQGEVSALLIPESVNELVDDILCDLRKNGLIISDRKYLNYYPLAQAKAWLSGHDEVIPQDLLVLKCYLWQKPSDRAIVESTLNRLCINPLQDKVSNVRALAAEVKDAFDAALSASDKPNAGAKALIKLRGELVRLYEMQQGIAASAQSESETALADNLLADLEKVSRAAHDTVGFTYAPLAQLAILQ